MKFMQSKQREHYERRIDDFIKKLKFPIQSKTIFKRKMLEPITIDSVTYPNFMVEASRRASQSMQTTSGRIAEWCVQIELEKAGL